tara:strand:- start:1560 stop:1844 length:285 start_codon:yes stop_codon:yes gene_type:complete
MEITIDMTDPLVIEFAALVDAHDLTYAYSDDDRCYQKGRKSERELGNFARDNLSYAVAREVWNAAVERKLMPCGQSTFFWPDPIDKYREEGELI